MHPILATPSTRRSIAAVFIAALLCAIVMISKFAGLSFSINGAFIWPSLEQLLMLGGIIVAGALLEATIIGIPIVLLLHKFRLFQWYFWAAAGFLIILVGHTLPDVPSRLPTKDTIFMYVLGHPVVENRHILQSGYLWIALEAISNSAIGGVIGSFVWLVTSLRVSRTAA